MVVKVCLLPLELVQEIVIYASLSKKNSGYQTLLKPKLAPLRLISRLFCVATEPFLFSEVRLVYAEMALSFYFSPAVDWIMATTPSLFTRYSKTLTICYTYGKFNETSSLKPLRTQEQFEALKIHSESGLRKALRLLPNIQVIHWDLYATRYPNVVIEYLKNLNNLRELTLDFPDGPLEPIFLVPFEDLHNLERISLGGHGISVNYAFQCARRIRDLIQNSGKVTHITFKETLRLFEDNPSEERFILHTLFNETHETRRSHILSHICLEGFSVKLDGLILSRIQNLTSLNISRADGLNTPEANYEFWNALQQASIFLKEIYLQEITEPHLQYLDAYTGLESLTLRGEQHIQMSSTATDNVNIEMFKQAQKLSRRLCCEVLPRHRQSLQSYMSFNREALRAPSYISVEDLVSLRQCDRLHRLAFAIPSSKAITQMQQWDVRSDLGLCLDNKTCVSVQNLSPEDKAQAIGRHMIEAALCLPSIQYIKVEQMEILTCSEPSGYFITKLTPTQEEYTRKLISSVKAGPLVRWRINGFCQLDYSRHSTSYEAYIGDDGFVQLK